MRKMEAYTQCQTLPKGKSGHKGPLVLRGVRGSKETRATKAYREWRGKVAQRVNRETQEASERQDSKAHRRLKVQSD